MTRNGTYGTTELLQDIAAQTQVVEPPQSLWWPLSGPQYQHTPAGTLQWILLGSAQFSHFSNLTHFSVLV